MKLQILALFLFLNIAVANAQSLVYYPFNSNLELTTNTHKRLWFDLKLVTNSYFSSLSTDFAPEITIKRKPKADFYLGVGTRVNFFNLIDNHKIVEGYFFNSGVRLSPFEKYKRVVLAFEISPYAGRKFDIGIFRTNFGIGYNFSR